MTSKKELRSEARKKAKEILTPKRTSEWSAIICHELENEPAFIAAKKIALYSALPDEPKLEALIAKYYRTKEIYLPRVEGDDVNYYRYFGTPDELSTGSFGIQEPTADKGKTINPIEIDFIVIPAIAFDRQHYRLGRGKGFYDRFIPRLSDTTIKIGVTYGLISINNLPIDPWDIPLDKVLNQKGWW